MKVNERKTRRRVGRETDDPQDVVSGRWLSDIATPGTGLLDPKRLIQNLISAAGRGCYPRKQERGAFTDFVGAAHFHLHLHGPTDLVSAALATSMSLIEMTDAPRERQHEY